MKEDDEMRRKDREITDYKEMLDLLYRCDTIRLGLVDNGIPYVVPLSFGLDLTRGEPVIYIHGAKSGKKIDCIHQNKNVCVEADIFYKVEPWTMGITARYESVIGFGEIFEVTDEVEKEYGLKSMLEHYNHLEHPVDNCRGLPYTAVYKIVLHSLTGKRNLPESKE